MTATIILKNGAAILLRDPFNMGDGVAGTISDGTTRRFPNDDIAELREWKNG